MGMISLYTHIPHILHILSTQYSQINHTCRFPCSLPVFLFPAGFYFPLPVSRPFRRRSRLSFSYPVFVPAPAVRFPSWPVAGAFRFPRLIGFSSRRACRRAGRRFCLSSCQSGRGAARRFCQLVLPCRLVLSVAFVSPGAVSFSFRPSARGGVAVLTVRSLPSSRSSGSLCVSGFLRLVARLVVVVS